MADTLILYRDATDTGLDLSSYVDVENGGINPGDAAIEEGVFVESATAAGWGAPFAGRRRANRPFLVNLILSAATRDALHGLFRSITERLDGACPNIEWRPEGASSSTYFVVRYGRLIGSDRYDYRRERARFARRLLELTCIPGGEGARRTGTALSAVRATGLGWASSLAPSNPGAFPLPSVGGDLPAGLRVAFSHGAGDTWEWSGFAWGLTYQATFAAGFLTAGASLLQMYDGTAYGPTSAIVASGIAGGAGATGRALQMVPTFGDANNDVPFAGIVYEDALASYPYPNPGKYRAFLLGRHRFSDNAGAAQIRLRDGFGNVGGVATMNGPSHFSWHDMGDVAVGPTVLEFYVSAKIPAGMASPVASPAVNIAALALIPRDVQYGYFRHTSTEDLATAAWVVDGIEVDQPLAAGGRIALASVSHTPLRTSPAWTYEMPYVGRRPVAPYTPSGVATAPLMVVLGIPAPGETQTPNQRPAVRVVQLDRYRFAK